MTERWTAARVLAALRVRYGREAVLVEQVANATGHKAQRWLDAIAVGIWPSRGLYLHAIEIKISRSDLVRELETPAKADAVARYCDAFYIALPEQLRIDDLPIPEVWGIYVVSDAGRTKLARSPAPIDAAPLDRMFVAALARRLVEQQSDTARLAQVREEGVRDGEAATHRLYEIETKRLHEDTDAARTALAMLHRALGRHDAHAIGRVATILRDLHGQVGALNSIRACAKELVVKADELESLARMTLPPIDGGAP